MTKGNGNLRGKAKRHLFQDTGFTALIYVNKIFYTLKICSLKFACYKWDERRVGRVFSMLTLQVEKAVNLDLLPHSIATWAR